ncbi:MAG: helix-turn-helix transcriptional regulator [Planctomycetaceae bacterium]|nr:helix-turn-helix transcriptional regulator [Planctomycetaceae bacterium]
MSDPTIERTRLLELLSKLGEDGHSQQEIATRAGLPAQYLSDLKQGRRPLTELTARRLGSEFGINHEWLLGHSNVMDAPGASSEGAAPSEGTVWVPCFPWPISGNPRLHSKWDGHSIELAGAAAARASTAYQAYVIQLGSDDKQGRLRKGDLILISQENDPAAEINVIKIGSKLLLARQQPDGRWIRLTGQMVGDDCEVLGHCLGIVWAAL